VGGHKRTACALQKKEGVGAVAFGLARSVGGQSEKLGLRTLQVLSVSKRFV